MNTNRYHLHGSCPREHENMPLLRSLAVTAAGVAINMALLTELFASSPRLRCIKNVYMAQRSAGALRSALLVGGFLARLGLALPMFADAAPAAETDQEF